MKKEIKDAWVSALRSGKYQQITGNLESAAGNCCLGVLCRVMNIPTDEAKKSIDGVIYFVFNSPVFLGFTPSVPPPETVGLSEGIVDALWRMNDIEKKSFNEIADWIELNVPETDKVSA